MRYIQISELQRIFFWHRHTATAILIHPRYGTGQNILEKNNGVLLIRELPDTVKLKETEAEAYSAILDIVIELQKELPMSYVFYGQDSLVEDNTRYDEIGVFLPNSHFLKNLERHVSKAEAIIYADN